MKIDGEQAYPVWHISAKWVQDGSHPEYPKWHEGLPENRFRTGADYHWMFREEMTQEQVEEFIREWWQKYSAEKLSGVNPTDLQLECVFVRYETWCLEWFCHYTYDTGQTDHEAIASFERFVCRMKALNGREGELVQLPDGSNGVYSRDVYCLMGAEDRWRWHGERKEDGENAPPPCRCDGCKKRGVIRINH